MRQIRSPMKAASPKGGHSVPGEADRGMALRMGDFYWQQSVATRTVRNIGSTRIELVEIELK